MIKQCLDNNVYLEILDKLKYVKNSNITSKTLYSYMVSGQINGESVTLTSHESDKMNGCLVLRILKDDFGELSFFMVFVWIDPHYPKLLEEFIEFGNDKAKELNIKNLIFATGRKESVIERRMNKYGFNKISSTYIKEVI